MTIPLTSVQTKPHVSHAFLYPRDRCPKWWGSFKFHKFRQESKSVAGSRPSCALVRSRTAHCIGQDRVRSLVYIQQHCTTFPFLPSHSWQHTFPSLPEASTPAVLHLSSLFLFKFWSGSFFFEFCNFHWHQVLLHWCNLYYTLLHWFKLIEHAIGAWPES